jgi:hypothetical protein
VSEQLLTVLKLVLLVLLYLFFFRVLRAVWVEIKPPVGAAGFVPAPAKKKARRAPRPAGRRHDAHKLVIVEPAAQKGTSFELAGELTIGRAAGCQITVDDTYVSQLHTRVFRRDGQFLVEDLGSTNGTYLNRQKVSGPMVMQRGDKLKVGNTVLELT